MSARLAALNGQITESERAELAQIGGRPLHQIARDLADATDEDAQEAARLAGGAAAQHALVVSAVAPLADPEFRARILSIRRKYGPPTASSAPPAATAATREYPSWSPSCATSSDWTLNCTPTAASSRRDWPTG